MANNRFDFVKSFELVAVTVLIETFRFEDVGDCEDEIWLKVFFPFPQKVDTPAAESFTFHFFISSEKF